MVLGQLDGVEKPRSVPRHRPVLLPTDPLVFVIVVLNASEPDGDDEHFTLRVLSDVGDRQHPPIPFMTLKRLCDVPQTVRFVILEQSATRQILFGGASLYAFSVLTGGFHQELFLRT